MERPKRSRPPVDSYAEDFPPVTSLDTSDDSESADDYFDSEDDNCRNLCNYVLYFF